MLIDAQVSNFNNKYAHGVDLRTLVDPNIAMAFGFFTNATITPFLSQGNYYLGLNFMMDKPDLAATAHSLTKQYFVE